MSYSVTARNVIRAFAKDIEGLTPLDCKRISETGPAAFRLTEGQCLAVRSALGTGPAGKITENERQGLEAMRLSYEFINELAGSDGKRALLERVKWLGDLCARPRGVDPATRMMAIAELGDIGDDARSAVPALKSLLGRPEQDFRRGAMQALARIGNDASDSAAVLYSFVIKSDAVVARECVSALREGDLELRRFCAFALGRFIADERFVQDRQAAVGALQLSLNDSDWQVSFASALALSEAGMDVGSYEAVFVDALKLGNARMKLMAIEALGEFGSADVIPNLIEALRDPEEFVRDGAAKALGRMALYSDEILASVVRLLDSEDRELRVAVARTMENIDTIEALSRLIELADDKDQRISEIARRAMWQYAVERGMDDLVADLGSDDWRMRHAAVSALGMVLPSGEIDLLAPLISDPQWQVRVAAADAVGRVGEGVAGVAYVLFPSLRDRSWNVRLTAARSLGLIGSREAVDPLIGRLYDAEVPVREAAVVALGRIGGREASKALDIVARDARQPRSVRSVALDALNSLGQL